MDDFAKEVITKMETYEKKEKRQFNKYDIPYFFKNGLTMGEKFENQSMMRQVLK